MKSEDLAAAARIEITQLIFWDSSTTTQRCRSETEKRDLTLENLFSSVLSQFKKYLSSENLKFNDLGFLEA